VIPHGGDIEPHTDQQAERVAPRLAGKAVSLWRCKGFKGEGAFARWHITSTDIHEASFPRLNSINFTYAVAFHGFGDAEIPFDILIGGAAPYSLKQDIETAIKGAITGSDITVHIASPDEKFSGASRALGLVRATGRTLLTRSPTSTDRIRPSFSARAKSELSRR
jgi:phage replication-related protein YjqB (UPF0714/DUF867 family)